MNKPVESATHTAVGSGDSVMTTAAAGSAEKSVPSEFIPVSKKPHVEEHERHEKNQRHEQALKGTEASRKGTANPGKTKRSFSSSSPGSKIADHRHTVSTDKSLQPLTSNHSGTSAANHGFTGLPQTSGTLVNRLKVEPGQRGFLYWYRASNVMPIIAASLGPISNLNSVCALADPWRINMESNVLPGDHKWLLALNAISLFLGCSANISLFLNFSGRVNYSHAQRISIIGWYSAAAILIALIIAAEYLYYRPSDSIYSHSEGFWNAVFTAILYVCSATLLLMNYTGHVHGMYKASFNLTKLQRRIMLNNVILILWIGLGALLFSFLFDIRYPDAVYFCMITITTIGLGDVLPPDNLSRALVLPFALVGLIIVGLIISTLISTVLDSTSEASMLHDIELHRIKQYEAMVKEMQSEQQISSEEAFESIRLVHKSARRRSRLSSVYFSLLAFSMFWLLGSMVFYFCESWSYFHALYFCSLCLLAIGYGDYHPVSPAGRSFFIIWSIAAVPMMTVLISNLSDNVFHWIQLLGDSIMVWLARQYTQWQESAAYVTYRTLFWRSDRNKANTARRRQQKSSELDGADVSPSSSPRPQPYTQDEEEDKLYPNTPHQKPGLKDHRDRRNSHDSHDSHDNHEALSIQDENATLSQVNHMVELIHLVRKLIKVNHNEPGRRFTYQEWKAMSKLVKGIDIDNVNSSYWFSEDSPMRYPQRETRYLLIQCLEALEEGLVNMVDTLDEDK